MTGAIAAMAARNPLVQTVGVNDKGMPFVVSAAITSTYYLVHPLGFQEQGTVMTIQEIRQNFTGFTSVIAYSHAHRK